MITHDPIDVYIELMNHLVQLTSENHDRRS